MIIISVVVCTYNRSNLLLPTLHSLDKQELDKNLFEVIVIDNNSKDDTKTVVENFSATVFPVRYFLESQQGIAYARKKGILEAKGKYVAYLDDDAKANTDWAKIIFDTYENIKPTPLAIGGAIVPLYSETPPSWFVESFEKRNWMDTAGFLSEKKAKYGFSGANMSFQKDILSEYFSTELGVPERPMGEDVFVFRKIFNAYKLQGKRVDNIFWYNPHQIVHHWTTMANTKVTFITARAAEGGKANVFMSKTTLFSLDFWKTLIVFALLPYPKLVIDLLKFNEKPKTSYVKFLQQIYYFKGFLTETIKRTFS